MTQTTPEPPSHRVAVMVKDNIIGAIALTVTAGGTTLGTFDPRNGVQRSPCQTPGIGRELFNKSLASTRDNGFSVGFIGAPNDAENS